MLAALCGVALWQTPLGESWENASYDYLFRFGALPVPNKVVLLLMDDVARREPQQVRGQPWDRTVHAELLSTLANDGCPLVVFDIFFESEGKAEVDRALAEAIRRQGHVILGADVERPEYPESEIVIVKPLQKQFLDAAAGWGVARTDAKPLQTARRHWPFPAPGEVLSLPWVAAQVAGAHLDERPKEQWLRYYGKKGRLTTLSYHFAFSQVTNYFRDKYVFIGSKPQSSDPSLPEEDKFCTPHTRWNGEAVGGLEIMATAFVNLINHEWLRRFPAWVELLALLFSGASVVLIALLGITFAMSIWVGGMLPELAVRRCVGARRRDVLLHVVCRSAGVAIAGVALGILVAELTSGPLSSIVAGIQAYDAAGFCQIALMTIVVTALAVSFPAWRACTLEPVAILSKHSD